MASSAIPLKCVTLCRVCHRAIGLLLNHEDTGWLHFVAVSDVNHHYAEPMYSSVAPWRFDPDPKGK